MARLTEQLSISTGKGENFNFSLTESYNEVFNLRQEIDNSDAFITLVTPSTTIGASKLRDVKSMIIKNEGRTAIEVQLKVTEYKDNGSDVDDANSVDLGPGDPTTTRNISFLLASREYIFLPNARWVAYAEDTSAANAKPTTNGAYLTLDTNEYVDSGADVDDGSGLDIIGSASETKVFLEPYTSATNCAANLFHIGDLIRINDEIMEVTAIGDKSNLANNYLTVIRGTHGSTAASDHADDAAIRLPFFNATGNFDKYSVAQTDSAGLFRALNFFGFGRVEDSTSSGIVPGSIAGKFYDPGYQELGITGITSQTKSGLTAGGTYKLDITVDGGTLTQDVEFTLDSSNTNFGGNAGVIRKIQDALDALFYDQSSEMFEKRVMIGIVDGDIRFTSGQHLSTSAISLTDTGDSGSFLDAAAQGRIPAVGNIKGAVAARLPDDTIIDRQGVTVPNPTAFFYDDGHGNIHGRATGNINYETGKIEFSGLPNAEFVITANYDSAHGGGNNTTSDTENMIIEISARNCNSKINAPIQIVAFN